MEKPFRTNVEEVQETKPFTTNDGEIPKETPFTTNAEEIQAEKREDVVSEKVCLPVIPPWISRQRKHRNLQTRRCGRFNTKKRKLNKRKRGKIVKSKKNFLRDRKERGEALILT